MRNGFSLIEMLVAVFIVSILVAMSVPYYSQHVMQQHRLSAVISLTKMAAGMEQYFLQNNTYTGASLAELKVAGNKRYLFSVVSATGDDFLVVAQPVVVDEQCGTLSLNARGVRNISGSGAVASCW